MNEVMRDKLNPGSPRAVAAGCTCPVLDNAHGEGIRMNGARNFYVEDDCPLHGDEGEGGYDDEP